MPARKLKEFLDNRNVKYVTIQHSPAYTAQEIAEAAHIPGDEFAKTVIVAIDGKMVMAVLPGSHYLETARLRDVLGARHVEIASEEAFASRFPGCELGAMPPFGNLYDMPVYVAADLTRDRKIAFNAGTHAELIQLAYEDFEQLVKPKVVSFSTPRPGAEAHED